MPPFRADKGHAFQFVLWFFEPMDGAGYNFTDFSDDLTDLSYRSQGWFLNIVGST